MNRAPEDSSRELSRTSGERGAATAPRPGLTSGRQLLGLPRALWLSVAVSALLFSPVLWQLTQFSLGDDLFSHILLVPAATLYFIYSVRGRVPPGALPRSKGLAAAFFASALAALAGYLTLMAGKAPAEDALAAGALAFVLTIAGIFAAFLGRSQLRALVFPLSFLVFMVPWPIALTDLVEAGLQNASASAAYWIFRLAGATVLRDGTYFQLPGFSLEVAPECSGIHSTLALFITSTVAAWFLLRRPGPRVALAAAVIPIAILRNGFRVFVIGELCVRIGPHMIDSPIHHHGGPIFFALSLIPFFLVLLLLMRYERGRTATSPSA